MKIKEPLTEKEIEAVSIMNEIKMLEEQHNSRIYYLFDIYGESYPITKTTLKTLRYKNIKLVVKTSYGLDDYDTYTHAFESEAATIALLFPSGRRIIICPNYAREVRMLIDQD